MNPLSIVNNHKSLSYNFIVQFVKGAGHHKIMTQVRNTLVPNVCFETRATSARIVFQEKLY